MIALAQTVPPQLASALPLLREGDGPKLCRRFCRMFGRPAPGTPHGPEMARLRIPHRMRLKDGPYLCVCWCSSFAQCQPLIIRRPHSRGRVAATPIREEYLQ